MPPRTEMLGDRAIGGEKPLSVPRGLEPLPVSLPLAGRRVGVLRPVIEVAGLAMCYSRKNLALSGSIAFAFICDNHSWHVHEPFAQLAEERLCRLLIPATLHQNIPDVPVLIHRPPQIGRLALDGEEQSSSAGEFHPYALTELDVNLSIHPALIVQPLTERTANGQTILAVGVRRVGASAEPVGGDLAVVCISAWPSGSSYRQGNGRSDAMPSGNSGR